jgi:threonine aldolase
LAEDHANAQRLAQGLSDIEGLHVHTPRPETNMVFFDALGLGLANEVLLSALQARGVRMGQVRGAIRAVTHLDVSSADIETAVATVRQALATRDPASQLESERSHGY